MPSKSFSLIPYADPATYPIRRRWLGTRAYWALQLLGWGLLGASLIFSAVYSIPPPPNLKSDILTTLGGLVIGVLVTHLVRVLILALRQRQVSWRRFAACIAPALVVGSMALINPLLSAGVFVTETPEHEIEAMSVGAYLSTVLLISLLLGVWVCFYLGILHYRRYQQATIERLKLDAAAKEAELRALRSQVNPHFLFNSLNCLRALIPPEIERPREALTILADLLRANLSMGQNHLVPLSQELEMAENYLALEQLRFESRLRVRQQIHPDTLTCPVPPFVVQTLIENAIKFGVSEFEEGGDISLTALVNAAGQLEISVENRGRLDGRSAGTGVGIRNARARLTLLFGPAASLTLQQRGDRVVAALIVPRTPLPLSA